MEILVNVGIGLVIALCIAATLIGYACVVVGGDYDKKVEEYNELRFKNKENNE